MPRSNPEGRSAVRKVSDIPSMRNFHAPQHQPVFLREPVHFVTKHPFTWVDGALALLAAGALFALACAVLL